MAQLALGTETETHFNTATETHFNTETVNQFNEETETQFQWLTTGRPALSAQHSTKTAEGA